MEEPDLPLLVPAVGLLQGEDEVVPGDGHRDGGDLLPRPPQPDVVQPGDQDQVGKLHENNRWHWLGELPSLSAFSAIDME